MDETGSGNGWTPLVVTASVLQIARRGARVRATLEQATSVAAEWVRLETLAAGGPAALRPILRRLSARLQGWGCASLRRALTVWFAPGLLRRLLPGENLPQLHDLEEVETMLAAQI